VGEVPIPSWLATLVLCLIVLAYTFHHPKLLNTEEIEARERAIAAGRELLSLLKDSGYDMEVVARFAPEVRKSFIGQLDLNLEDIEAFLVLVVDDPKVKEITPEVLDMWWPQYKVTRQAIRRWPGYRGSRMN
jgi:hypothetical protein